MAGVLAVTGLAGCSSAENGPAGETSASSASPTPTVASETILEQMNNAIAQAASVHVSGTWRIDQDGTTRTADVLGTVDGSNLYATVAEGDKFIEVAVADGATYVRGNQAYWSADSRVTSEQYELIKDKWVRIGAEASAQLGQATAPSALVNLVMKDLDTSRIDRSGFGTTEDGAETWVIGDGHNIEFVIDPSTSLPISMTDGASDLIFDQWNAVPEQKAPAADQVVDGSGG